MAKQMITGRVRKAYQFIEAHRHEYPVQTLRLTFVTLARERDSGSRCLSGRPTCIKELPVNWTV